MFTLKVFQPDGSYESIACKSFIVSPNPKRVNLVTLDGSSRRINSHNACRVIVENANGQTIDMIKLPGGDHGMV